MAQKTLLAIAKQITPVINLPTPQIVISATDGSTLKLLEMIRSVCDDLLKEYDWEQLVTVHSFNTFNGTNSYPFPTDIDRFISGSFFDTSRRWELEGPLTSTQWELLQTTQLASTPYQRYRVFGGQVQFYPTPTDTFTFVYEFITQNYVLDGATGVPKSDFTADDDICRFDHRLVIYGTKLKWLQSIGADTTAALTEYSRQLEYQKGADKPAAILDARGSDNIGFLSTNNLPDGNWG
jgi:hypothetical protein